MIAESATPNDAVFFRDGEQFADREIIFQAAVGRVPQLQDERDLFGGERSDGF